MREGPRPERNRASKKTSTETVVGVTPEQIERKRNPALAAALVAALAGTPQAHASDRVSTLPSAATYSNVEVFSIDEELVKLKLAELKMRLRKGGDIGQRLAGNTDLRIIDVALIIDEISAVTADLTRLRMRGPQDEYLKKLLNNRTQLQLVPLMSSAPGNNEPTRITCNGQYFTESGFTFFGTSRHCLTTNEARTNFFPRQGKIDFVVQEVEPPPRVTPLQLPSASEEMTGKVVLHDAVNRFHKTESYATVFLPVTQSFLDALWRARSITDRQRKEFLGDYWYVMPPHQGHLYDGDIKQMHAKGQSGTFMETSDGVVGHRLAGVLHSVTPRSAECHNSIRGLCTTIGFAVSPQKVRQTVSQYVSTLPPLARGMRTLSALRERIHK